MTKIDIFSGFLGAGKTTLIKKLIAEAYSGEKLVLIENEFGEINIDGGFLKESGIEISEMSAGCICCSLVGDFNKALKEVVAQFHPDRILIEPSGVGKLSDVIVAVQRTVDECPELKLNSYVTVADASKVKVYMKNFGEFYNNQIEAAGTIILSRTQKLSQEKLEAAAAMLREKNPDAAILTTPWDELDGKTILSAIEKVSLSDELLEKMRREHEIEEAALKKETDRLSQEHLAEIQKELSDMREEFKAKKAQWDNEKEAIGKVQQLRADLESANAELEKAQREYDLNKAAELQYGKIPALKKALEAEEQIAADGKARSLLRDKVTEEEIARIIERWTGIPVAKLMEGEREKLLHLEDILHQRVVGQDEAVRLVSEAILRSRAGIADPDKPIGSFLFLGPTGVGKTELAKTLAEALFDSERNLVRIDMSEYMEKFSVSRLIGAPPGYVGYEEGGQLTEAVRRKPYSVVLFDEVEKAHPDVFNILLQVLDDGRITDSQGRTVDFKNTILILTSNLGSQYLLEGINAQGEISDEAKLQVDQLLKKSFRPEFLNRLDEIVCYKPLTKENITAIVDLLIGGLNKRLADKQLKVVLTPAAKSYVIDNGYDPLYGARPLRRFLQHTVETLVGRKMIADEVAPGSTLTVDCVAGELVVH